ncbi:hypothetical protein MBLNU230_g2521t1 [Neophaeotheca triangularis]
MISPIAPQRLAGTKRHHDRSQEDPAAPSKRLRGVAYPVKKPAQRRPEATPPPQKPVDLYETEAYSAKPCSESSSPATVSSTTAIDSPPRTMTADKMPTSKVLPSEEKYRIHGLVNSKTACFSNAVVQLLSSALTASEITVLHGGQGGIPDGLPGYDTLLEYDNSHLRTTASRKLESQASHVRNVFAKDDKLEIATYLGSLLEDMRTGIYGDSRLSVKKDNYVTPWLFQQAVAHGHGSEPWQRFHDGQEQQCVSDYLSAVMERLGKERPSIASSFTSVSEQHNVCGNCNYKGSTTPETETSLNVAVTHKKGKKLLSELIKDSLSSELDGYTCSKCHETNTTVRYKTFTSLPRELFVNMRRLIDGVTKNEAHVNLQAEEHVMVLGTKYTLRALIRHRGDGNGGHYTAFRKMDGKWYHIDDKNVTAEVAERKELSLGINTAYRSEIREAEKNGRRRPRHPLLIDIDDYILKEGIYIHRDPKKRKEAAELSADGMELAGPKSALAAGDEALQHASSFERAAGDGAVRRKREVDVDGTPTIDKVRKTTSTTEEAEGGRPRSRSTEGSGNSGEDTRTVPDRIQSKSNESAVGVTSDTRAQKQGTKLSLTQIRRSNEQVARNQHRRGVAIPVPKERRKGFRDLRADDANFKGPKGLVDLGIDEDGLTSEDEVDLTTPGTKLRR